MIVAQQSPSGYFIAVYRDGELKFGFYVNPSGKLLPENKIMEAEMCKNVSKNLPTAKQVFSLDQLPPVIATKIMLHDAQKS